MVEDDNEVTNEKEETSTFNKIFAFITTLILVPILFAGTCVPVGVIGASAGESFVFVILGYSALFTGGLVWRAFKTKNRGTMWAIILILCATLFIGLPLLLSIIK